MAWPGVCSKIFSLKLIVGHKFVFVGCPGHGNKNERAAWIAHSESRALHNERHICMCVCVSFA